jgi:nicotinic acid mononucleotide adenylyltransferase
VAHVAIANAGLRWAEEVVWLLPRAFPHKPYSGADFQTRLRMLEAIAAENPQFSVAVPAGGLYIEMADEARGAFSAETEIALLCGRDAAERIAGWDYGRPNVFREMLERYWLLVAERTGSEFTSPDRAERVIHLAMDRAFHDISSTEMRMRVSQGLEWRDLVPAAVVSIAESVWPGKPAKSG